MLRFAPFLLLAVVTACDVGDVPVEDQTAADIQEQQDFIADITPDLIGEIAMDDGEDYGDDIGMTANLSPVELPLAHGTYQNEIKNAQGDPMTCPDPSVSDSPMGGYRYFMVCTSDYNHNSFPIRKSNDLVHWKNVGFVFPDGDHPGWALDVGQGGRYWAPELYRIGGQWVVYFGTRRKSDGEFVIGVAWSATLRGHWSSRILHTRGEFNDVNSNKEFVSGVIDPSVMRGADGNLYLYYAKQSNQIWVGQLSADGLHLQSNIHYLFGVSEDWEKAGNGCVEGPEPFMFNGMYYLLYSGASTWTGSYAVGVAVATNPMGPFVKRGPPILQSGRGFIAPGHSSHPTRGPDGNLYLLYHSLRQPSHTSGDRKLMLDRFNTDADGIWPIVHDGEPSSGDKPVP
jgi:beta-xylosidase